VATPLLRVFERSRSCSLNEFNKATDEHGLKRICISEA
jgi:hypothetical protein